MTSPVLLGRYRLVHRIGEGGMGVVHLAVDEQGRACAVKVLRAHVAGDPEARARLSREVATLRRVQHPRVAEVLDADVDGATPFVVTRYVPGETLDDRVAAGGALDGARLAPLGRGLVEALDAIHAAGVVHRDLKPSNVMLLDDDPVLIDFGIAHVADDVRLTMTGLVMGTPGFLAPEVLSGRAVSPSTDWWGLASVLAFAATGRPPFGRGPMEAVLDRVRRGEADLTGVPDHLVGVLTAALSPDEERRPGRDELIRALDGRTPGPVTIPVPPPPDPPSPVARREPATVWSPPASPPTAVMQPREQPRQPQPPHVAAQVAATRPARPRRTALLWLGALVIVAIAAVAPTATAILGGVGAVVARTVDRSIGATARRHHERGPRRSDPATALLTSPWHMVTATLATVPALILPAMVGVSAVFLAGLVIDPAASQPNQPLALGVGAVGALVTSWWGPGGASLRRGTRAVVRAVTPGEQATAVVAGVLVLVLVAALVVVVGQAPPDWRPLDGPPFTG